MTVFLNLGATHDAERQALTAESVARFIRRHAIGLHLLLEQASDPAGIESLGKLIALSDIPLRCPVEVQIALSDVVTVLSAMPLSAIERVEHGPSATDPYAAFNWNLARVEELYRSFISSRT